MNQFQLGSHDVAGVPFGLPDRPHLHVPGSEVTQGPAEAGNLGQGHRRRRPLGQPMLLTGTLHNLSTHLVVAVVVVVVVVDDDVAAAVAAAATAVAAAGLAGLGATAQKTVSVAIKSLPSPYISLVLCCCCPC